MSVLQLLPAHVIEGIVGYVADEAAGASAKQLLLVSHRWRRAALRHINRECTIDLRQQKALGTITMSNKHETWSFGVVDGVVEMDSRAEELTANMAAHVRCLRIAVNVQDVFGGEAAKALEPAVRSGRLVCMRLRRLVFALGNTAFVDADPVLARSSAERLSCWVSQMAPRANDVALVETAGFNGLQKGSRSGPEMQQQSSGLHVELALRLLGRASHMDVCNLGPTYFADTWELGDRRLASIRCRLDDGGHMAQVVRSSAPSLKTLWATSHAASGPASILCSARGPPTQYPQLRRLTFIHADKQAVYPQFDPGYAPMPRLERLVLRGACAFDEALFRGNAKTLRSLAVDVDERMARVLETVGPLESLEHVEADCWVDYAWAGQAAEFARVAVGVAPSALVLSLGAHLLDVADILAQRLAQSRCAQGLRVLRLRGIRLLPADAALVAGACPRLGRLQEL